MSVALREPMTQAEFFDWAEAQNERYELNGFHPVLMPDGSGNHARIGGNILVQLRRRLGEDGPCEALGSDAREDRILKPEEYAAVASIKRYVIVEQSVIGLTVLWRSDDEPWHFQTLKAGDTLSLPEIGVEMPVDQLYGRVTFGP